MKTHGFSLWIVSIVSAISFFAISVSAQTYKIDWYTIDGGGGTSSGGAYTLIGTIGQPDAGKLTGGNFVLDGGFWGGVFAIQQVGAPTLHIVEAGPNVTISWDPNTPGFVLQEIGSLTANNIWNFSASGSTNPVTIPRTTDSRFFRLLRH